MDKCIPSVTSKGHYGNSLLCLSRFPFSSYDFLKINCDTSCNKQLISDTCWKHAKRPSDVHFLGLDDIQQPCLSSPLNHSCWKKCFRKKFRPVRWSTVFVFCDIMTLLCLTTKRGALYSSTGPSRDKQCQWQNPAIFKVLLVALLIFSLCSQWWGSKTHATV